jgi:F420-non-reducing hydrogenase iron-sulfur subunit
MRLIRVMCSGRIDPSFVLRAFSKGADGVFIGACHLGECNYITHGNYHTLNMVLLLRKILEHLGLNPERLRMAFMSGAEANLFVESVNDFVRKVKEIGPIGRSEGLEEEDLKRKLTSVTELIPYIRLVERERLRAPMMSEEEYYQFFASEALKRLFKETIVEKLTIHQIISLLREGPRSTAEIAKDLRLTPSEVSKLLNASSRQRLVRYDESRKGYALA